MEMASADRYNSAYSRPTERCWSGRTGTPGKRVSESPTMGSNPILSAKMKKAVREIYGQLSSFPRAKLPKSRI